MLNKEKYAQEIVEIAINGNSIAIVNNKPCSCDNIEWCSNCDLIRGCNSCDELLKQWANSEYKEKEIGWSKVPVDTSIIVWRYENGEKYKRHFAYFKENKIYAWNDGRTSYTASNNDDVSVWKYAEIAEGVNCNEWYKD